MSGTAPFQFEHMTWMDVERHLQHDDRVILTVGAVEQHAYLSLLTDVLCPLALAEAAARREPGWLVAPAQPYGLSPDFAAYPGTLSLRAETFAAVARDLLESLYAQGFRGILVNNGHGGNVGVLRAVISEFSAARPDARVGLFNWWMEPPVHAFAAEHGLPPRHANWSESFPQTRVGLLPEGDKPLAALPSRLGPQSIRAALGDGSGGGPYHIPDEVFEAYFEAAVGALVAVLRALGKAAQP